MNTADIVIFKFSNIWVNLAVRTSKTGKQPDRGRRIGEVADKVACGDAPTGFLGVE